MRVHRNQCIDACGSGCRHCPSPVHMHGGAFAGVLVGLPTTTPAPIAADTPTPVTTPATVIPSDKSHCASGVWIEGAIAPCLQAA
jgi:hypothetical protein